jgi:ABC-type uncharacterized transport system ATPase component
MRPQIEAPCFSKKKNEEKLEKGKGPQILGEKIAFGRRLKTEIESLSGWERQRLSLTGIIVLSSL